MGNTGLKVRKGLRPRTEEVVIFGAAGRRERRANGKTDIVYSYFQKLLLAPKTVFQH